jgi:spermidine synthase
VPPLPGGLVAFGRSLAFRLGAVDARTNRPVPLPEILYVGQGMSESVAVSDDGRSRLFSVSGKIEASTSPKDMRLQRMLGHLPAMLHPRPRSVLIVGFGSGATSGTFTLYPGVERIVVCEIEPLIPRVVARYFADANYDVVSDPRVHIVYDDARHFLLTTRETFDLITSDPIHPWVKGSAALYSREYFDLVRRHLNPGGLVTQWLPLYQSSEATVKGEIATFFASFPGGSVWANDTGGEGYDVVLLGGDAARRIDLDALDARLARADYAPVARSLREVGFGSWVDLLSTYLGRDDDLGPWLAGAAINRDRKLWLQYQAGLETLASNEAEIHDRIAAYRRFPEELFAGSAAMQAALRGGEGPRSGPRAGG